MLLLKEPSQIDFFPHKPHQPMQPKRCLIFWLLLKTAIERLRLLTRLPFPRQFNQILVAEG
jgi:hypothetical protein